MFTLAWTIIISSMPAPSKINLIILLNHCQPEIALQGKTLRIKTLAKWLSDTPVLINRND